METQFAISSYKTSALLEDVFFKHIIHSVPNVEKKSRGTTCPIRSGFSQPSHHRASGVEAGGGRGHTSSSPAQPVRWNSEQKQSFRSTGSANINHNDATNNSTVSGSPEGRDDHQLNSGENEKNVIFNYSSQTLTPSMTSLLNRGFNFSILPEKNDMTLINVDLKRFKRAAIWNEFWFGRESEDQTDLILKK